MKSCPVIVNVKMSKIMKMSYDYENEMIVKNKVVRALMSLCHASSKNS